MKWRVCGFSESEASQRVGVSQKQVELWCSDISFVNLLENIPETQAELMSYFEQQEKFRKKRMLEEIDSRTLEEVLAKGTNGVDKQTFEYAMAVRKSLTITDEQKAGLNLNDLAAPKSVQDMLEIIVEEHRVAKKDQPKIIENESQ